MVERNKLRMMFMGHSPQSHELYQTYLKGKDYDSAADVLEGLYKEKQKLCESFRESGDDSKWGRTLDDMVYLVLAMSVLKDAGTSNVDYSEVGSSITLPPFSINSEGDQQ